MMNDQHFQRRLRLLKTTATDGTVAFPRFQQDQLVKLHNVLVNSRNELVAALQESCGLAETEALIEIAETLQQIKSFGVHELDYAKWKKRKEVQLREEGKVEKGRGVVVISADSAAPIYSVFVPLATAIAGSNAAVCILANLPKALGSLLQSKLFATLDRTAFLFDVSLSTVALLQQDWTPLCPLTISRAPSSTSSSLCAQAGTSGATVLVDRLRPSSPLLDSIARLVVRGAAHAGGRLPGSVARVLVHDETAGALVDALLAQLREAYGADATLSNDLARSVSSEEAEKLAVDVRRETEKGAGRVLCGGSLATKSASGFVFPPTFIENPSRDFLGRNLSGPVCSIATFGSSEDALHTLSKLDSQALYAFSDETETLEYLAVETDVGAFWANDIPLRALYDPLGILSEVSHYQKKVVYVAPPKAPAVSATSLFAPFTPSRRAYLATLLPRAPLSLKRAKFSNSILRVFFLQGVFLTVGTVLSIILGSTGYGLYSLARRFLFTRSAY